MSRTALAKLCRIALVVAMCVFSGASTNAAAADSYPVKPVRVIVGFPAGQTVDVIIRLVADRLTAVLHQPVLVENRPGAGGMIGADYVAKSSPDGYTFLMGSTGAFTIAPNLYANMQYDPVKDFEPIATFGITPLLFVVARESPIRSMNDLATLARSRPDQVTYGTTGVATTQHLTTEMFASMAGIKARHIPYKSGPAAFADVIGGTITFAIDTIPGALPLVKSGRLRVLGITSTARTALLPDVPTVDEQGFKGFEAVGWFGLLAPAGTPAPVLDRLARETVNITTSGEPQRQLAELGVLPLTLTRERFRDMIRSDIGKWRKVIEQAGVKID